MLLMLLLISAPLYPMMHPWYYNENHTRVIMPIALKTQAIAPEQKQATDKANKYLDSFLDKTLKEAKKDFQNLPKQNRLYILHNSGDAKPFILIAMLPEETQIDVTSHILDLDRRSAQLFCTMPITTALNEYKKARRKATHYNLCTSDNTPLPMGTYLRLTYNDCENLSTIINTINNKQSVILSTNAIKDINKIDKDIVELLLVNQQFFMDLQPSQKIQLLTNQLPNVDTILPYTLRALQAGIVTEISLKFMDITGHGGTTYLITKFVGRFITQYIPFILIPTVWLAIGYRDYKQSKINTAQNNGGIKFIN